MLNITSLQKGVRSNYYSKTRTKVRALTALLYSFLLVIIVAPLILRPKMNSPSTDGDLHIYFNQTQPALVSAIALCLIVIFLAIRYFLRIFPDMRLFSLDPSLSRSEVHSLRKVEHLIEKELDAIASRIPRRPHYSEHDYREALERIYTFGALSHRALASVSASPWFHILLLNDLLFIEYGQIHVRKDGIR